MSLRLAVLALMLVLASPVLANDVVKVTHVYSFRVSLDEEGRTTGTEALVEVPSQVLAKATALVQAAEFEPARVAGRAVPSRATVNVRMDFEGDRQHLRVASTKVTSSALLRMTPPVYPAQALRSEVGAMVSTTLTYRPDGSLDREASRIDSIDIISATRLDKKNRHREQFEAAVWATIQGWTMVPDEVDGQAIAMTTRVPMSFCPRSSAGGCENRRIRETRLGRDTQEPGDEPQGWQPIDTGIQLAKLKPTVAAAGALDQP